MNEHSNEPIQSDEPQQPAGVEAKQGWLTRKVYSDPAEKKKDFWIGFGLFFGINIFLWLCRMGLTFALFSLPSVIDNSNPSFGGGLMLLSYGLSLLPWIVNIGLMIYFGLTRAQIAMGMLTAFSVILVLTLIAGVATSVFCFAIALTEGSEGYAMVGQVIVGAGVLVALIGTAIAAVIFYSYSRSNQDASSLRTAKFLAIVIGIVIALAVLLTIGYVVISLRTS